MNCVSETNYQRLHAIISLVNEYSVHVPSVNFDQMIQKYKVDVFKPQCVALHRLLCGCRLTAGWRLQYFCGHRSLVRIHGLMQTKNLRIHTSLSCVSVRMSCSISLPSCCRLRSSWGVLQCSSSVLLYLPAVLQGPESLAPLL